MRIKLKIFQKILSCFKYLSISVGERKDCTILKKLILLISFISLLVFCTLVKGAEKLSKSVRLEKLTFLANRERIAKYTSSSLGCSIYSLKEK